MHAKDDDFTVEMTTVEQLFEIFQLAHRLVVVKTNAPELHHNPLTVSHSGRSVAAVESQLPSGRRE
jgi:hypothetical protein